MTRRANGDFRPFHTEDYGLNITTIPEVVETLRQGLTLAHFAAQPEPFPTQNTPQTNLNTP